MPLKSEEVKEQTKPCLLQEHFMVLQPNSQGHLKTSGSFWEVG